jgi:oxalate decarboxylase/phosphoglucose isomerase-like protein (cupin superfamily)
MIPVYYALSIKAKFKPKHLAHIFLFRSTYKTYTKGTGRVLMDGEYEKLEAGMCHYCPKGHTHSLMNDSDAELEFFAVVPEQN